MPWDPRHPRTTACRQDRWKQMDAQWDRSTARGWGVGLQGTSQGIGWEQD